MHESYKYNFKQKIDIKEYYLYKDQKQAKLIYGKREMIAFGKERKLVFRQEFLGC